MRRIGEAIGTVVALLIYGIVRLIGGRADLNG